MKTERNIIAMDEYGKIHFPDATVNNIWMSTNELMDLFGIIYPTLGTNINAIYKSGILYEYEVQRSVNLSDGVSIDIYALPMIAALSFRLNTLGAYKVREYIIKKLTTNSRKHIVFEYAYARMCG